MKIIEKMKNKKKKEEFVRNKKKYLMNIKKNI